jgi:metallo-beta-lactamase class B
MSHVSRRVVTAALGAAAVLVVGQCCLAAEPALAGPEEKKQQITRDDWFTRPWLLKAPAFAIADNLYYVGNQRFSSHLVVGEKGTVLIDTPHKEHCYLLLESIRSLGFDPADITLVLHTHYHCDHTGCTRRIMELSGAPAAMGAQDAGRLRSLSSMEFTLDFWNATLPYFEPFEVERRLKHGDTIDLGDTVIRCHHTPGHTPGAMTYTLDVEIDGEPHTAVLFGGPGLNFLKMKGMYYPGAKDDFARTLDYLEALDADVWLGAHPFVNRTLQKHERREAGEKPSPFLDRKGWLQSLKVKRINFERLVAQRAEELELIDQRK